MRGGRPCSVAASVEFFQTNKDLFSVNGWLCGRLGGAVVSQLTSHQEGLSSSPRVWPSGQVCLSLCGFPAASSHSPANMHIRRLRVPPGRECVSWDEPDLCGPASNRRPSLGCHKPYPSIPTSLSQLTVEAFAGLQLQPVKECALNTPL